MLIPALFLLVAVPAAQPALSLPSDDDGSGGFADSIRDAGESARELAEAARKEAVGPVTLYFRMPKNLDLVPHAGMLFGSDAFRQIVEDLNTSLRVPGGLQVIVQECGVSNAFYSPSGGAVVICYEILDEAMALLRKRSDAGPTDWERQTDINAQALTAAVFFLYHEIGHALKHKLRLPVTGREEDAADQIAVVLLITQGAAGRKATFEGARFFSSLAESAGAFPEWDVHSPDKVRAYNILCLMAGSGYSLIPRELLPEPRANRCPKEWSDARTAWGTLLLPHLKEASSFR